MQVALRFVVAELITMMILVTGIQGPGPMLILLGVSLVICSVLAALWASMRLSGIVMFNVTVGAVGLSVAAATSGPGGPSFGQFLALAGGMLIAGVGWIVVVVRALVTSEDEPTIRHRGAMAVAPLIALTTTLVVRSGVPTDARFAVSRSDLDVFAAKAVAFSPDLVDQGRIFMARSETPDAVGAYKVRSVILTTGNDPAVVLQVDGDCGWFATCTLVHLPNNSARKDGLTHLGGDWYSGVSSEGS